MRIGIFGGSFNPIHWGHIGVAKAALEKGLVDEVWLMVSPQNPLKVNASLAADEFRLDIAHQALKELHLPIKVSDFEFHLERPSFTWKTLAALKKKYPQEDFSLIIGGDNWEIFDKWAHWEEILTNYPIIVYPREGTTIIPRKSFPSPSVLNAPLFPFSSTEIRKALADNASDEVLSAMIPSSIINACRNTYCKSSTSNHDKSQTTMVDIQLNESGTRHLEVEETTFLTIHKYSLFQDLVGSSGYVTEAELDKLKFTVRSLIANSTENCKDLLDLCIDVIYHEKMKAFGLQNLIAAYNQWLANE